MWGYTLVIGTSRRGTLLLSEDDIRNSALRRKANINLSRMFRKSPASIVAVQP